MTSASDTYDVVVVGSGVAGALAAWKLSQLGSYRILILEAGDSGIFPGHRLRFFHTMDKQANRSDTFAPYKDLSSRIYAPAAEDSQRDLKRQKADEINYYDYTDASKEAFKAPYTRLVGGSTWAWRGNAPRLIPSDFRLRSQFGQGRDWPLDYDELEPWYCEAERELGVSGNHDEWNGLLGGRRSQPFPMPGIPLSYSDQRVKARIDGKRVEGTQIRVVTTPQARNSVPYDGRQACEGHNNCIPLCPIDAKYDATVHLRRALATNKVELRRRAVVCRLEEGKDRRIAAVRYIDWSDAANPRERLVRGEQVVLAANAIETPKILLMSGNLANSSGEVGRNLMDHVQFDVIASFREPLYPFRGPQSITSIENFRDGEFRRERSAFRMTIGNDGWGRAGSPAVVIDELLGEGKYGSALPKAIEERISSMLRLSFSAEMLPEKANRIDLSDKRDALKIPRPRFTFSVNGYSREGLRAGVRTAEALFGLMNARLSPNRRQLIDPQTGQLNWNTGAHIMGTAAMGNDRRESVVDRWGRAHDVRNLWIVGSSVFPTSGTANSTLTIAALTLRSADAMHRGLASS